MQSNAGKLAVVAAAIAAVVVLYFVLSDGDSGEPTQTPVGAPERDTQPAKSPERGKGIEQATEGATKQFDPEAPAIVVEGGQPAGGILELEFKAGDQVAFEVESDVAEEVHVHGYDVTVEVEPGKPAKLEFPADIEGVFEVELEGSAVQIAELTVNPD